MSASPAELRELLINVAPGLPEDETQDLWEAGALDFFAIFDLVAALELEYQIELPPDQLRRENFQTLAAISETLNRVLASK